jgi:DNA-binding NarL/FixJ family response regulator
MNSSISIFLVDDHKVFAQSFESYISIQEGFIWKGAGEGDSKTFNNIIHIKPDIVLLDYHLAKTNGLDFLQQLHAKGFKGMIILLTMNRDSQIKRAVKSFGARGFVSKETDGSELLLGIRQLTEGTIDFLELPPILENSENSPYLLTDQEMTIANLVCSGLGSEEIAKKLNISVHTVNTHRRRILSKTHSENFVQVCLKLK